MTPFSSERTILARHRTEDGEIQLQKRQQPDGSIAFEIILNGVFLMASYNQTSARALATKALDMLLGTGAERILVGGLGMGFTLQEVLAANVAAVDVVERNPDIIAWNRTYFAPLNGSALADPRVHLLQTDLYAVTTSPRDTPYDAILLDVDNGPSWLAHTENARFYTTDGLTKWKDMIAPGGVLGVWSAQPEPAFLTRMQAVFGEVEEIVVQEVIGRTGAADYFLYFGRA